MTTESRRGACPEVLHPMETGDGLLARLRPLESPLAPDALRGLCAAARSHGNGILEVTRRGNLQVRGLRPESVAGFADAVVSLGVGIDSGPPVQTGALAGRDAREALDVRPLAATLRARLAEAPFRAELGPKVSVLVDGGGALHLDALDADLRLRADGERLHVLVGGDGRSARALGTLRLEHAAEAAVRLAGVIARRGREARARDVLRSEGTEPFTSSLAGLLAPADPPEPRDRAEAIGSHALRGGRLAVGLGLAFGQSEAGALEALIDAAEHWGFTARSDDPRRHISACSGAPACAAAQMATRTLGASLARAAAPLLDGSIRIHLSGCAKGCAHPGPAALTLVGASGACDLVVAGNASSAPLASFACESLEPRLERLSRWVSAAREPGEDSAGVLRRFGPGGIAHAFGVRRNPR